MKFTLGKIHDVICKTLIVNRDSRGSLVEIFRNDELKWHERPVMGYASITNPGIVRGPHEHKEQMDLFVFLGPFTVWLWDSRKDSPSFGTLQKDDVGEDIPTSVIVPPGVVHAYKCTGKSPCLVINCPNKLYGGEGGIYHVDEIRHEADPHSIFKLE